MPEITQPKVVSWQEVRSTITFQRTPKPAMLTPDGFITSYFHNGESVLVKYDRLYIVQFLVNRVIKQLHGIPKQELKTLFEEALTANGNC